MRNKIIIILFVLSVINSCAPTSQSFVGKGKTIDPYNYTSNKNGNYSKACVVSAHPLASAAGNAMFAKGGNAFDAAIATQLALAVVYSNAGNIGGGGFLVARKNDGALLSLDYREMAPAAASRNMYLDKDGNAQNNQSEAGHLSCGVPGTVAGLFATLKYAKLPFKELIQPAIDLAQHGFAITQQEADGLNGIKNDFIKYSTRSSAFVKAEAWKAGNILKQPELAATLIRIRDNGAAGFYEGETAKLIVEEMQRGNGLITYSDLKNYVVKERTPVEFDYRGYHIISMPPPSSGGILLAQMCGMIESYPVSNYGFQSTQSVQLMTEAERRAYADRAEHMGDPDFWNVPQQMLMSKAYLTERMKNYTPSSATPSRNIWAGKVMYESEQTTHISIADNDGNMVSVTTTLNDSYGSKTVVGGAGFIMNDEMDDFSIKPGVPNMYGAVGGDANAIAPGKRMLSSMTPTLVLKDNKPFMVVGTPGGTTIPTSVFQSIVNVIDFGMNATDAVNKPKFHHQWLPDTVFTEKGFSSATASAMQNMNYKIVEREAIGRTEMILISFEGEKMKIQAAADERGDDSAAGE